MNLRGRNYQVERRIGADGKPAYVLTGPRGGRFFTLRNVKFGLLFLNARSLGNRTLDGVWLSDASGELVEVSA